MERYPQVRINQKPRSQRALPTGSWAAESGENRRGWPWAGLPSLCGSRCWHGASPCWPHLCRPLTSLLVRAVPAPWEPGLLGHVFGSISGAVPTQDILSSSLCTFPCPQAWHLAPPHQLPPTTVSTQPPVSPHPGRRRLCTGGSLPQGSLRCLPDSGEPVLEAARLPGLSCCSCSAAPPFLIYFY